MFYGVEMLRRVLVLRGIAATYMPADEAEPEVDPRVSHFQALLATAAVGLYISDLLQMLTLFHVFALPDLLNGIRTAKQVSPGCDLKLTAPL
jgi:hypothetical protein